MSADDLSDQWRRDQLMIRIAANGATVTGNPTEADSDTAPQTSSSRVRTPNVTVTANPLEADSGILGAAPCASPGAVIAGPRVCVSPPPRTLAVDIARSNDDGKKIAQRDNDNNNKDATKDDDNDNTNRHEQHCSPHELRPGDKCSTQLNIVDGNGGLLI